MVRRTLLGVIALAVAAVSCLEVGLPSADARDGDVRIALKGPGGSGSARFRARDKRSEFEVEAEHLKVASGAVLTVNVDGKSVGTMTVGALKSAKLELSAQRGNTVPAIKSGSVVTVVDADGNVLMSGTF
jgi:hypothetical protein